MHELKTISAVLVMYVLGKKASLRSDLSAEKLSF